ncbi:MAG: FecR family protein [Prevotella sp.]|nr:FecR family protein [Prevotella sp.]
MKRKNLKNWANNENISKLLRTQWDKYHSHDNPFDLEQRDRIWRNILRNIYYRQIVLPKLRLAAAAIALFIAFSTLLLLNDESNALLQSPKWITYRTEEIMLPDSTRVWLSPNSVLKIRSDFPRNRETILEGGGTFDVAKQKGRNFNIKLNGAKVVVKGTCFSLNQRKQDKEIVLTLYRGQVDFITGSSSQQIKVTPYHQVRYSAERDELQLRKVTENIKWEGSNYKIEDVDIHLIAEFLQEVKNCEIRVLNVPRGKYKVTGNIDPSLTTSQILDNLCFALKMKYIHAKGVYTITQ